MYIVYQALHIPSNKVYIGVTSYALESRMRQHYSLGERLSNDFQIYLKATEREEWVWGVLEEHTVRAEAYTRETFYINQLHADFKLNMSKRKGKKVNHKGSFKKGLVPYMQGKFHTEASKEKMRETRLATPPPPIVWSDDQKAHLRLAQKDRKRILCIELDRVFESITQASIQLGIPRPNLRLVLNGRRKHARNLTFKYLEKGN
jgi:hypothetical protein